MEDAVLKQWQACHPGLRLRSAYFSVARNKRSHSSVYADPAARGCAARRATRVQAGKGFGNSQEAQVTGGSIS